MLSQNDLILLFLLFVCLLRDNIWNNPRYEKYENGTEL